MQKEFVTHTSDLVNVKLVARMEAHTGDVRAAAGGTCPGHSVKWLVCLLSFRHKGVSVNANMQMKWLLLHCSSSSAEQTLIG